MSEGTVIQHLKHLHLQEISNPSAGWLGVVVGGAVAAMTARVGLTAFQKSLDVPDNFKIVAFLVLGILYGGSLGLIMQQLNRARYKWHYIPWWVKLFLFLMALITLFILTFPFR